MADLSDTITDDRDGLRPESPPDLTTAAAAAGLLDVAYTTIDSPLGELLLARTEQGLVRVGYLSESGEQQPDEQQLLQELADRISPRVLRAPRALDPVRRQLDEFFDGRRRHFELPLDWRLIRGFGVAVLRAAAAIPFGAVASYGQLAAEAGNPRAARAVGTALGHNPMPIVIPCHRVLRAGGALGGYTGGIWRKQRLLELESATRR
jgi:methylated-DNA-[protein]-cysteine S-methyltransferase